MATRIFGLFFVLTFIVLTKCTPRNMSDYEMRIATGKLRKACAKRVTLPQPPNRIRTKSRVEALRAILRSPAELKDPLGLQAVLITSRDEHQTEFISNYDKRRQYISGFSGINGNALVTMSKAALWVDEQYHLQANEELDCEWLLMREGNPLVPSPAEWLNLEFPNGARIGADPKLMSAHSWHVFEYDLHAINNRLQLVETKFNLVDRIWEKHSETEQEKQAFSLEYIYTGKNWTDKVIETRQKLRELKAEGMVITALDEIAWLLNIRGRDIPYTRFVKGYVLLSQTEIILYVDQHKTKINVTSFFNAQFPGVTNSTVRLRNYDQIWSDLKAYTQVWKSILVPSFCLQSAGASKKIYNTVPDSLRISAPSPIIYLKAQKNPTEIRGMRNAHIRDGAAMCRFFEYLESRFKAGDPWDEVKAAKEIDKFRMEQDLAVNISFPTMVAFGAHGAQPHYVPTPTTSKPIFDNGTVLIDSGGQYCDGTTDVSRTIHLGEPSEVEKDSYTRVLMGSIQLSTLIFPDNLEFSNVDILARAPLWQIGEDYLHGTGHGIGAFLNVHESPIYVDYRVKVDDGFFKPGYFFSNEPGVYLEERFGIRLENVLEVVEIPYIKQRYQRSYLGFRDVTLVPYCNKLIKFGLLSIQQKRWLNEYNARVRRLVGEELKRQNATEAFYWMMENTAHIPEDYSKGHVPNSITIPTLVLLEIVLKLLCGYIVY